MAYTAVPTVTTGDLWTAANHNTYIKDNFAATIPDIFTAKGDLIYGNAANQSIVLNVGSEGAVLKVGSSDTLTWEALISQRKGGSSTAWNTPGTTTYSASQCKIYVGASQWTGSSASSGSMSVTLPGSYDYGFLVFVAIVGDLGVSAPEDINAVGYHVITTGGFTLDWVSIGGNNYTSVSFDWMTIGPA